MNPALILFGIQSVIRLGKVGRDASEQYVRDAEALFPDIRKPEFDRKIYVNGFFGSANYQHFVQGDNAPYKAYWGTHGVHNDLNSQDTLFAAAVQIKAEEGIDLDQWLSSSQVIAGATLIEQWDPDKAPLSPFARVILAAGDIALEYLAVNPGLLGVGGNGEKLIGAFAHNLSALLPDDGHFGANHKFGERLLGVFLRAGLETINKNSGWTVSEEHVQKLISASVTPIIQALPENITDQLKYHEVTEALIGPAASAAMQTLAEHPDAFFGADFNAATAVGALTQAVLGQAAKTGLDEAFIKDGLMGLYSAALGVAAEKPHLFINDHGSPQDQLAKDLIQNFASVLMQTAPPFDGTVGNQLAAAVLQTVGANAHRFSGQNDSWQKTAADILAKLTEQLSDAFKANQGIENAFSKTQLMELGCIVINQIASTPEMIVGPKEALAQLLATVAQAMAKDTKLLLDGDDWLKIVQVAAQEAAANPGRLFRFDPNNPTQTMAAQVIQTVLTAAGISIDQQGLNGKTVLFGKTLREAIIMVLRATSGHLKAAQENLSGISSLVTDLNALVTKNSDQFGNKEWLYLFRALLASVLEGQELDALTVEGANNLLMGRM